MREKRRKTPWGVMVVTVVFVVFLAILYRFTEHGRQNIEDIAHGLADGYIKEYTVKPPPEGLTMEEALLVQKEFIQQIGRAYGQAVGYKVGLTNRRVQERFGIDEPVRGFILERMLRRSPATVPFGFGTRLMMEGDLIVEIKDESINRATTIEEALKGISRVIPFVELPDLLYEEGTRLNAPLVVAINVGARLGVIGEPIEVEPTKEWLERLSSFRVALYDQRGEKVAEGTGANVMDHPLNVILWLARSLKKQGKKLKRGDIVSVGSITPLLPVKERGTVKAVYRGLSPEGDVELTVTFD